MLGVHVPSDEDSVLARVAHWYNLNVDEREAQLLQQNVSTATLSNARVQFRVTNETPPFMNGPGVLLFVGTPKDFSCLVKPDVRSYPKTLEQ